MGPALSDTIPVMVFSCPKVKKLISIAMPNENFLKFFMTLDFKRLD
jgi:hypothetical protein